MAAVAVTASAASPASTIKASTTTKPKSSLRRRKNKINKKLLHTTDTSATKSNKSGGIGSLRKLIKAMIGFKMNSSSKKTAPPNDKSRFLPNMRGKTQTTASGPAAISTTAANNSNSKIPPVPSTLQGFASPAMGMMRFSTNTHDTSTSNSSNNSRQKQHYQSQPFHRGSTGGVFGTNNIVGGSLISRNESSHSTTLTCSTTIDSNNTSSDFSASRSQSKRSTTSNTPTKTIKRNGSNNCKDNIDQHRHSRSQQQRRSQQQQQQLRYDDQDVVVEEEDEEDEEDDDNVDEHHHQEQQQQQYQPPIQTLSRKEPISPLRSSPRSSVRSLQPKQQQQLYLRESFNRSPSKTNQSYGQHEKEFEYEQEDENEDEDEDEQQVEEEEGEIQRQPQKLPLEQWYRKGSSSSQNLYRQQRQKLQQQQEHHQEQQQQEPSSPRKYQHRLQQNQQLNNDRTAPKEKFAEIFVCKRVYATKNSRNGPIVLESPPCSLFGTSSVDVGGGDKSNSTNIHQQQQSVGTGSPPEDYLDAMLFSRGYSTKRYTALETGYYNEPTELQEASYSPYIAKLVKHDDIPSLRDLFHVGLSSNPSNYFGDTIAHYVCRLHKVHILQVMIEYGCDIRISDHTGTTPLHEACRSDRPSFDLIDVIIQQDIRLFHIADSYGKVPLAYVPQSSWTVWNDYIDSRKDSYWPPRPPRQRFIQQRPPKLALLRPNSRPALDPIQRLKMEYILLLAGGKMRPSEVDIDTMKMDGDYGDRYGPTGTSMLRSEREEDTLDTRDMPPVAGKQRFSRPVHVSGLEVLHERTTSTGTATGTSDHYPSSSWNSRVLPYDDQDDDEDEDEDASGEEEVRADSQFMRLSSRGSYFNESDDCEAEDDEEEVLFLPEKLSNFGRKDDLFIHKVDFGRGKKGNRNANLGIRSREYDSKYEDYDIDAHGEPNKVNRNKNYYNDQEEIEITFEQSPKRKQVSEHARRSVSGTMQSSPNPKQYGSQRQLHQQQRAGLRASGQPENRKKTVSKSQSFDDSLFHSPDPFERVMFNSSTANMKTMSIDLTEESEEIVIIDVEDNQDEHISFKNVSMHSSRASNGRASFTSSNSFDDDDDDMNKNDFSGSSGTELRLLHKQLSGLVFEDSKNLGAAVMKMDRMLARRPTTDQINPLMMEPDLNYENGNNGEDEEGCYDDSNREGTMYKNRSNKSSTRTRQDQNQQRPKRPKAPAPFIQLNSDEHSVSTISLSPISKQLQLQTLEHQQKLQQQRDVLESKNCFIPLDDTTESEQQDQSQRGPQRKQSLSMSVSNHTLQRSNVFTEQRVSV